MYCAPDLFKRGHPFLHPVLIWIMKRETLSANHRLPAPELQETNGAH